MAWMYLGQMWKRHKRQVGPLVIYKIDGSTIIPTKAVLSQANSLKFRREVKKQYRIKRLIEIVRWVQTHRSIYTLREMIAAFINREIP